MIKLTFLIYDVNSFRKRVVLIILLMPPRSVSGGDMEVEGANLIQRSKVTNKRPASDLDVTGEATITDNGIICCMVFCIARIEFQHMYFLVALHLFSDLQFSTTDGESLCIGE